MRTKKFDPNLVNTFDADDVHVRHKPPNQGPKIVIKPKVVIFFWINLKLGVNVANDHSKVFCFVRQLIIN